MAVLMSRHCGGIRGLGGQDGAPFREAKERAHVLRVLLRRGAELAGPASAINDWQI
jgi:hypothetical protein